MDALFISTSSIQSFILFCQVLRMAIFSAGDPLGRYAGTFPGCTRAVGYAAVVWYLVHSSDGIRRKSQLREQQLVYWLWAQTITIRCQKMVTRPHSVGSPISCRILVEKLVSIVSLEVSSGVEVSRQHTYVDVFGKEGCSSCVEGICYSPSLYN